MKIYLIEGDNEACWKCFCSAVLFFIHLRVHVWKNYKNKYMDILPDELREEILKHLTCNELMIMMTIDLYTKSLIENSLTMMKKLPIYLRDNEADEFCDYRDIEPILESKRKTSKIIVRLKRDKIMKHIGIFKRFSDTIRSLDIDNYAFDTIDQLRIILRFLQNLKTFSVSQVTFIKPENKFLNSIVRVPKLSLKKLTELNCVNSDATIFTLFENNFDVQFRKIRLKCDVLGDFSEIFSVVSQQGKLHSLTLDGVTNCDIFSYDNFLKCQLRHLEIVNCSLSRDQMRRLMTAIKNQHTMVTLKIINTPIPSTMDILHCYRQIFGYYVREVHVDIRQLSFFHSHQFQNGSVKNLTIYGDFAFENLPIFINFIKMLPNIEKLSLKGTLGIGDKYLFHILSIFNNLEELTLPGFSSRAKDSNFSNLLGIDTKLKSLILDYIDYDVKFFGWKNIVSNLKTIEKLIIKRDYGKVSNEIVDVIVKTLNLKHLELGIGVVSEEILSNIVYSNCCDQLKVLKIAKSDFDKISKSVNFKKIFNSNSLLLHLCDADYFQ